MDTIRDFFGIVRSYFGILIRTFDIMDVFDILIIAFIVYRMLTFMRRTFASSVIKGIVFLLIASALTNIMQMNAVNFLLRQAIGMGALVLAILFQPELRRLFGQLGNSRFSLFIRKRSRLENAEHLLESLISAVKYMASNKTGALIIIEREIGLNEYAMNGTNIDADISPELLTNIFVRNSPLHDGALIIRDGRILAASCMLPLSNNISLGRDLGMRHRAGVGISERSDAISVIVSEELGTISVAIDGLLRRNLSDDLFEELLREQLLVDDPSPKRSKSIEGNAS
ncbi:MAG: diadenylate cyclase CdaA [Oscillospiraceae bacterium]|nr:diadenylate cyclase CdaA [Oscillospiraceae bacterium]